MNSNPSSIILGEGRGEVGFKRFLCTLSYWMSKKVGLNKFSVKYLDSHSNYYLKSNDLASFSYAKMARKGREFELLINLPAKEAVGSVRRLRKLPQLSLKAPAKKRAH